jgi:LysM repeat protein
MTRYRGKHRAPTNTGRLTTTALTVGALSGAPLLVANPAFASDTSTLDAIAQCESTGNPRASGPVTKAGGHFGLFQFDMQTWRSVGGKGNPRDASVAEQYKRAQMLMDKRDTQPWNASKDCWRDKVGKAKKVEEKTDGKRSNGKVAEQSDNGKRRAGTSIPDGYRVQSGDTLTKLAVRFDVKGGFGEIAKANGIANPDRIYVGQILN